MTKTKPTEPELECEMSEPSELVKHPKHYNQGIECWDYVISQRLGFLEGNVVKYVTRYQHKNGIEDLYKARAYLEKLISVTEDPVDSRLAYD